jgi:hypothetical protein
MVVALFAFIVSTAVALFVCYTDVHVEGYNSVEY